MSFKPKFSIILPTFNREKKIKAAIISVLNQSYEDFELLIIDDERTTDNTKEVVESFEDSRIRYFVHGESVSEARNYGLNKSEGEIIAFIDSDDIWLEDCLEKRQEAHRKQDFVASFFEKVDVNGKETSVEKHAYRGESFVKSLLRGHTVPPSAVSFRKKVLSSVEGFDEQLELWEDSDMWLRLAYEVGEPYVIRKPLLKYFVHRKSVSKQPEPEKFKKNLERFVHKHEEKLKEHGIYKERVQEIKNV